LLDSAKVLALAVALLGAPLGFVGFAWLLLVATRKPFDTSEALRPFVACVVGSLFFLALPLYLRRQWAQAPAAPPSQPAPESEETVPLPVVGTTVRDWTTLSADGQAELGHKSRDQGCQVSCSLKGQPVWSADVCLGEKLDFRFVSNDCERVAVLHPMPSGRRWQVVEVAHVYNRSTLDYAIQAGGLFQHERQLQHSGNALLWLQGAVGTPGPPPRYDAAGTGVELVTVDGQLHTISLIRQP
jgi:hypothetical protein